MNNIEKPLSGFESLADKNDAERTELLSRISANALLDIKTRVAFVLNHYPDTRNDDIALAIRYWRLFDREIVGESDHILIKDIYKLTRINSIIRARAKIQNTYNLFLANEKTRKKRAELDEKEREVQLEDQPDLPLISIYCDESGKTDANLIVGSVWINDAYRVFKIYEALTSWKAENNIQSEFHFKDLTKQKIPHALTFVKQAIAHADVLGFKAVIIEREHIGSSSVEDSIFRLHYQLVVQGVEHELKSQRLALPRVVSLTKDKDDGADRLRLTELRQKLMNESKKHFNDSLEVNSVEAEDSKVNIYLQLADLFSGSLNRVLAKDGSIPRNHKDEFAEQVLTLLGVDSSLVVNQKNQDFVEVIRIH